MPTDTMTYLYRVSVPQPLLSWQDVRDLSQFSVQGLEVDHHMVRAREILGSEKIKSVLNGFNETKMSLLTVMSLI